ncbi:HDOD domain-containing protein [Photobacterium sp. MCCC 1A19761]|uniref:EAL and HDOD domain-containing protein n=1 Tax=Photobacterium sp. MCCC 1A19761 TaxID=3115000 RepID=UPI00307D939D
MHSYLARQPVLNRNKETVGYELLFRDGPDNCFPEIGDEQATNRLLADNFFTHSAKKATGGKLAFINFPYCSLIQRTPLMFSKKSFIIEILETCEPTDELLEAIMELHQQGYLLALDDFVPSEAWNRFLPYVHFVKFDVQATPIAKAGFFIRRQRERVEHLKFLAEKVETHEEFEAAREAGFDFFQGYFFSRPEMIQRKTLTPCALTTLRLYQEISQDNVDYKKVETIIANDVSLSYKLLRHVNNMTSSLAKPITSFRQALVYLGEERLRRFISFVATAHATERKPRSLYGLSVQRAQFCERLSKKLSPAVSGSQAFLAGLFSLLDSLLDQPIEELITQLPLSEEVKDAVIHQQGQLGALLKLSQAYDQADWEQVTELCKTLSVAESVVAELYLESLQWSSFIEKASAE